MRVRHGEMLRDYLVVCIVLWVVGPQETHSGERDMKTNSELVCKSEARREPITELLRGHRWSHSSFSSDSSV